MDHVVQVKIGGVEWYGKKANTYSFWTLAYSGLHSLWEQEVLANNAKSMVMEYTMLKWNWKLAVAQYCWGW